MTPVLLSDQSAAKLQLMLKYCDNANCDANDIIAAILDMGSTPEILAQLPAKRIKVRLSHPWRAVGTFKGGN